MEIYIFTGVAPLIVHRRYSSQTPQLEDFLTAFPAFERLVDGKFGIQHGVGTCKPNSGPGSGCIEKDDPFPATWICRLNDFKLDSFVVHDRSSSAPEIPRMTPQCVTLHVQPLNLNVRNHRRCCIDDKCHDCKSKSDKSQGGQCPPF